MLRNCSDILQDAVEQRYPLAREIGNSLALFHVRCRAPHVLCAALRYAVRVAFTPPWSTAPANGNINELELVKRSMYGRARLDLFRARVMI
jgi:hypothetical protein